MRTEDTTLEELYKRLETNPDEARERLTTFLKCVDKGEPVPNEIIASRRGIQELFAFGLCT